MATSTTLKGPARKRLLAAANELFYEAGVQSVGIDRVIERAGVARASLYNIFGSKEALVNAYLEERHAETAGHISAVLARFDDPRERLLGVFDAQAELFAKPGFRGCAFVSASAEAPTGSTVVRAADEYRAWVRGLFQDLAAEAGVRDPQLLAAQLHLLYDGASLSARMDRSAQAAVSARAAAAELVDKALATPQNRGRARTNPSRELGRQTPRLSR